MTQRRDTLTPHMRLMAMGFGALIVDGTWPVAGSFAPARDPVDEAQHVHVQQILERLETDDDRDIILTALLHDMTKYRDLIEDTSPQPILL